LAHCKQRDIEVGAKKQEGIMPGRSVRVRSSEGGEFDCFLSVPEVGDLVPAVVLASAVHGVDADITGIAEEFARHGFIAAAPDLFWRTIPGPLSHDDDRTKQRSQPRHQKIEQGESDITDALAHLHKFPQFNGRAAVMGFCYGGPYAILGPKRLGYAAGISCHGTQMLDYLHELEGATAPICIMWGDRDHRAPVEVLEAYQLASAKQTNLELHIFPGVQHGYMMAGMPKAFDRPARDFSMRRAIAILNSLRKDHARESAA
jgi:carboxymethylenebutenolidase